MYHFQLGLRIGEPSRAEGSAFRSEDRSRLSSRREDGRPLDEVCRECHDALPLPSPPCPETLYPHDARGARLDDRRTRGALARPARCAARRGRRGVRRARRRRARGEPRAAAARHRPSAPPPHRPSSSRSAPGAPVASAAARWLCWVRWWASARCRRVFMMLMVASPPPSSSPLWAWAEVVGVPQWCGDDVDHFMWSLRWLGTDDEAQAQRTEVRTRDPRHPSFGAVFCEIHTEAGQQPRHSLTSIHEPALRSSPCGCADDRRPTTGASDGDVRRPFCARSRVPNAAPTSSHHLSEGHGRADLTARARTTGAIRSGLRPERDADMRTRTSPWVRRSKQKNPGRSSEILLGASFKHPVRYLGC